MKKQKGMTLVETIVAFSILMVLLDLRLLQLDGMWHMLHVTT